jgi:heme/copper-type cytochrome/quinol oxidase subunit 3
MVMLVVTEAMVFLALVSAYFFVRAVSPEWPQGGIHPPDVVRAAIFSVLLLGSSIPMVWAEHAAHRDRQGQLRAALAVAFVMAAIFLGNQADEFRNLEFSVSDNAYASLFVIITGLHGIHVLGALVMSSMVQAKAWTGRIGPDRDLTLRVFGIYWHFVDGVWVIVFSSLYLAAHVGTR